MLPIDYIHRKVCIMEEGPTNECSSHWKHFLRAPDHESNLGEFDVIFCRKCQTGFTDPYPTEETSRFLYEEKLSSDFDQIHGRPIDKIKDLFSRQLIRSFFPDRDHATIERVLDFGCGNGRFALSAGYVFRQSRVDAVDFQEEPPPSLKCKNLPRIHYQTVRQFETDDCTYDLIILRHVLEHTYHPVELLRKLSIRLRPDGLFYIEVPNFDSGCAKLFGRNWTGYYVPRHIFHYTSSSLEAMIAKAGLTGKIDRIEMPLMGNMIAILGGWSKANPVVQALGALLHPVQLLTEAFFHSSTCINVRARKRFP